ncbi:AraC family transcriptional regulator ligand-binding domain-containing protein [Acinetobacter chinensis]|uniref:AraC family transcriptional regulator ligand-binding domain-containing protein n=1 Tax=Acinetobacter chinensis TaxID=2004650 RepID=A0ABU3WFS0_9GAMM|nr:AraC family transcriptional regulator ligand-binding domain-containing protein [Acinetobacter chinensis]MDV2469261.1 AraC family transcriptional regulator ligand-binding domain-containing protein [Acinetobacter chinensis]
MQKLKDYTGSVYGGLGHLLYAYCQQKGIPVSIKLQQVQNLERFDFSLWRSLLIDMDQQLHTPALGLEIAEYVEPKHLGIIAYIALSCESLSEALYRYHDFHRLIYDGTTLQVEMLEDLIAIRWGELPIHLTTQTTDEIAIALMLQFLKHYMEFDDIHLHEVHFRHPAPKNQGLYEQYFRCKVRFSQPYAQVLLPVSELSKPIRQGDQTLQHLLMQQAQALLDKLPNSTQIDQRLQQAILLGLQKHQFQIEHIATQLNLSVRQLQRHLQQQGSTYQQRMQEIRFLLARQYLQNPHLSLHEIALLLGYSEQSAFQRAFKQWANLTPQQWRLHNPE